jgi:hypothetical protein
MQLQATRGFLAVPDNSTHQDDILTGGHIQVLADLLIRACQLARSILSSAEAAPDREAALVSCMIKDVIMREMESSCTD